MSKSAVSQVIDSDKYSTNLPHDSLFSFEEKDETFTIQIAKTIEEKKEAYRLIYDIYIEKNFITENNDRLWYSIFDAAPSTTTLVIKKDALVVGCLTMILDSGLGFPADELFSTEVEQLRGSSKKIIEIVSLGIKKGVRGASSIFKNLFNINLYCSYFIHGAKDCIITVNPSHVKFYEKRMGFERISDTKNYKKVNGAPAVLMKINGYDIIKSSKSTFFKNFDVDGIRKNFEYDLQARALSASHFLENFGNKEDFFKSNREDKIDYFQNMYPEITFDDGQWVHKGLLNLA